MISKESIETAYCFLHQKWRVYEYSTLDWQKDDIEYAIDSYVDTMPQELYKKLSSGRSDYLRDHTQFSADMAHAVRVLELMLGI